MKFLSAIQIDSYSISTLFLGLFVFAPFTAQAGTNVYVRTDGSDTACNGLADAASASAPACAFRTVQKGVNTAISPGDVVNIRGDHSNEGLIVSKASGCAGAGCASSPTYITIQTAPGAAQYSGIISPGIQINHDYIIVRNLGITGSCCASSGYAGVSLSWSSPAGYNRILNNHFYNPTMPIGSSAIAFGVSAHYNLVDGNLIEGDTNPSIVTGHQTGTTGTILSDSYYSWTTNQWQGRRIWDFTGTAASWSGTDGGTVVANDAHSITTSAGITWNTGDCYGIGTSYWIPIVISGTGNTISNNIIRNLANSERVFDGMADNTVISGNEVSDLLNGNELPGGNRPVIDNCGAHPDIFQVWNMESLNVTIDGNFFHDLESQTGMLEGNGHAVGNWTMRNNIFANITERNTVTGMPGDKFYNNTVFNVSQIDQTDPIGGWATGVEYKNNLIIGGSLNPDYGTIVGLMGSWSECAKNVITKTWLSNTDISHWIGQGGTQAILTANGSVYVGTGGGSTGGSSPNWSAACPNVGATCADNGITWTNTVWNTTCAVTGTQDAILFDSPWYLTRENGVTSSFTCSPAAFPGGDPNIYDAEGIKTCRSKNSSDIPASNNYYGIWNPPIYSTRTASLIFKYIGDPNPVNGGNPQFVAAYTNCVTNACDFHLLQNSPLIGRGANLSSSWPSATDKDGNARPAGAWTIGAYEWKASSPPKPPAKPAGLRLE